MGSKIIKFKDIPIGMRKARNEACKNCSYRKSYAKAFDIHFDWVDCPYNCEYDYDHLMEELKNLGKKKE